MASNYVPRGFVLYRLGVVEAFYAAIHDWVVRHNLGRDALGDKQGIQRTLALMIGQDPAMVAKWCNPAPLRVAAENVVPLELAFALFGETSIRALKDALAQSGYADWRDLARKGYERARDGFEEEEPGRRLPPEHFWWLFHVFRDNVWIRAVSRCGAAVDGDGPHPEVEEAYRIKAREVRWSMGAGEDAAVLDYPGVLSCIREWFDPWTGDPGGEGMGRKWSRWLGWLGGRRARHASAARRAG